MSVEGKCIGSIIVRCWDGVFAMLEVVFLTELVHLSLLELRGEEEFLRELADVCVL